MFETGLDLLNTFHQLILVCQHANGLVTTDHVLTQGL